MNNSYHNYGWTRFFIKLSSVFGIVIMLIISGFYFYYLSKFNSGVLDPTQSADAAPFLMKSYGDLASYKIVVFIIVVWMTVKTIICNIGLIKYSTLPDNEFIANKWSLAVLSLSIGGFFTPYLLTWLPNTDVKATRNARITIVRFMGSSWLFGSILCLIGILAFYSTVSDKTWSGNDKNTFGIILAVLAVVFVLNLVFGTQFWSRNAQSHMAADTARGKFLRFVAGVYTFIVTIELVIQIIMAILKLISAIARAAKGESALERVFAVINAIFTAITVAFMIYLICSVIRGLWRREDEGIISFNSYGRYNQEMNNNQGSARGY